jgi:hypothetical protein
MPHLLWEWTQDICFVQRRNETAVNSGSQGDMDEEKISRDSLDDLGDLIMFAL